LTWQDRPKSFPHLPASLILLPLRFLRLPDQPPPDLPPDDSTRKPKVKRPWFASNASSFLGNGNASNGSPSSPGGGGGYQSGSSGSNGSSLSTHHPTLSCYRVERCWTSQADLIRSPLASNDGSRRSDVVCFFVPTRSIVLFLQPDSRSRRGPFRRRDGQLVGDSIRVEG
jgi:hypothetical protein